MKTKYATKWNNGQRNVIEFCSETSRMIVMVHENGSLVTARNEYNLGERFESELNRIANEIGWTKIEEVA